MSPSAATVTGAATGRGTGPAGRGGLLTQPADLRGYRAAGGYGSHAGLLAEVGAAGLRGRGGAWFPVADKWRAALAEPGPRVVVANGAEDEPGSRKDRFLMSVRPHLVLDGALRTAEAIGAELVVLYVNPHALESLHALRTALAEATAAGLVGTRTVELVAAPAAYVAGEDSAAAEFLSSGTARPRVKPPYPTVDGVAGRPTVVSNVETLAHVALVARAGGRAYREVGPADCPGTMLVTLPEECVFPGVYEVEVGAWLDEVLRGPGGGFVAGPCRGVQVGGPASGWLAGDALHVRLTPADLERAGSALGCGAVRVLAAGRCAVDAVTTTSEFFAREQCGKCPPCRMATQFVHRATLAVLDGTGGTAAHLDKAPEIVRAVGGQCACSLVRFPLAPLASARQVFAADFAAHLAGVDCGLKHLRRTLRIEGK